MDAIFTLISDHPKITAFLVLLTNGLWALASLYFKHAHERRLQEAKHDRNLDLERRKKVFEMKVTQYESFMERLDKFAKRNQVDMPKRMQPIFDDFMREYLVATDKGDKELERESIASLGSATSSLMQESLEDYLSLKGESNRLKLTASDEMLKSFESLEDTMEESFNKCNDFMGDFVQLSMSNDPEATAERQRELEELGHTVQQKSKELFTAMRADLAII